MADFDDLQRTLNNDDLHDNQPEERTKQFLETANRHMVRYAGDFAELVIDRAEGSYIYDIHGRPILDFTSGQMCATPGHNHPSIVTAIEQSCPQVTHLFSWMLAPPSPAAVLNSA